MRKIKLIKWVLILGFSLTVLTLGFIKTALWFDDHKFIFQVPVTITFNQPVQIVKRELLRPQIIEVYNDLPMIKDLTPIEEYICDKWGAYDCKVALSVARAESGMRADAFNVNTNGSIDLGIFQINSVHYKKLGCSLQDVTDPYKNVDCAYQIWQDQGWSPWSVFKNGSFKEKL